MTLQEYADLAAEVAKPDFLERYAAMKRQLADCQAKIAQAEKP